MTRRQAIEKCRDMWDILAENGGGDGFDKREAYMAVGGRLSSPTACFFCDYNHTHKRHYCDITCIGADIWGGHNCTISNSLFDKWVYAKTPRTRQKYAKQIADGCRKLLEKMG